MQPLDSVFDDLVEEVGADLSPAKPLTGSDAVFLTTREAAALVRLSPRSLERMRAEGTGPRFCKIGGRRSKRGRIVYRRSDLIAWVTSAVYSGTSQY